MCSSLRVVCCVLFVVRCLLSCGVRCASLLLRCLFVVVVSASCVKLLLLCCVLVVVVRCGCLWFVVARRWSLFVVGCLLVVGCWL